MIIINQSKPLGVFNGRLGTLRGFIYSEGQLPPELPEAAIVELDSLDDVPIKYHFNGLKNHVLIPTD